MTFDPRCAIVAASDSGIGKATAVALAQNGMAGGVMGPQAGSNLTSGRLAQGVTRR
jgi:NAD(P)-dependent dehydrogenase (short-subunit alcohol dehydrogenase family)